MRNEDCIIKQLHNFNSKNVKWKTTITKKHKVIKVLLSFHSFSSHSFSCTFSCLFSCPFSCLQLPRRVDRIFQHMFVVQAGHLHSALDLSGSPSEQGFKPVFQSSHMTKSAKLFYFLLLIVQRNLYRSNSANLTNIPNSGGRGVKENIHVKTGFNHSFASHAALPSRNINKARSSSIRYLSA